MLRPITAGSFSATMLNLVWTVFLCSQCSFAQTSDFREVTGPKGENLLGHDGWTYSHQFVMWSQKTLKTYNDRWDAPFGTDIINVYPKKSNTSVLIIVLSDGSVYTSFDDEFSWSPPKFKTHIDVSSGEIVGDALYYRTSSLVYVSRDTSRSWQVDTVGVGGVYKSGIAVDTSQFVYLSTDNGLYKQHPDSNVWRKVTTLNQKYLGKIFIDRKNRIFVNGTPNIFLSSDGGTTWKVDTTGLGYQTSSGYSFCDDVLGNVYATKGLSMWRSNGGTQPWVRIAQSLFATMYDPSAFQYRPFINRIAGDTVLSAATAYGLFLSSDQGSTWTLSPNQMPAGSIYGLVKTSTGKLFTSTNLGVYSKDLNDTLWMKTYPPTGFLGGRPLFSDNANAIYTLGAQVNPSVTNSMYTNWKSVDAGKTWSPDTLGMGNIGNGQVPVYFVDESGAQHIGSYDTRFKFYVKLTGQSWTADTLGYTRVPGDLITAWGSDKRGSIYVATSSNSILRNCVWKRPIGGGTWVLDTVGLNSTAVYSITVDRAGSLVAGTLNGVYKKVAGAWKQLPYPAGLNGYYAFVVSVDSTGSILAGFSTFAGFNTLWRGVYATKDNGVTWTKLGLDSISVRGLVSYGDTTFAYTYQNGMYRIRNLATEVVKDPRLLPTQYSLGQNYPNPFNPSTTVLFGIPTRSKVRIRIYGLLGQLVNELVNEELPAGQYQRRWMASVASGVYFCRFEAISVDDPARRFVDVKKMILLR